MTVAISWASINNGNGYGGLKSACGWDYTALYRGQTSHPSSQNRTPCRFLKAVLGLPTHVGPSRSSGRAVRGQVPKSARVRPSCHSLSRSGRAVLRQAIW